MSLDNFFIFFETLRLNRGVASVKLFLQKFKLTALAQTLEWLSVYLIGVIILLLELRSRVLSKRLVEILAS